MNRKIYLFIFVFTWICLNLAANQNKYPLDSKYHNDKNIAEQIKAWNNSYPGLFYSEIIGYSTNERLPIRSFKISLNPNTKNFTKPAILIVGQIHGEEPLGVEICLNFAQSLLDNYKHNDPQTKLLLDAFDFYFIPTINPEGFAMVNNGKYYNQRKNKTDTNKNKKFNPGYDGVDLNRNFPFNWNNEEQFKPTNRYYAGSAPASESETRAIMDFIKRENIYFAFNYHSSILGEYNEKIFYPWLWSTGKSPHWYDMRKTAIVLSRNLKKDYANEYYEIHSSRTSKVGFLRDWAYSEVGTFYYDIEVGGKYRSKSIVFPKNEMRDVIVQKNTRALYKALDYVRNNTLELALTGPNKNALKYQSVCYYNLNNPNLKPKKSNEKGLVFLFVPPEKEQFNIFVNHKKYKITLPKQNRKYYVLKVVN